MSSPRTRFYRDKLNARVGGVCAGIADYIGVRRSFVRASFIVLTFMTFPMTFIAYFLTVWLAPVKPIELYERTDEEKKFWQGVRKNPRRTARDVRSKFRGLDRRLADLESYVTSSNSRLAREIEQLR